MENFILFIKENLSIAYERPEQDMEKEIQAYMQWVEKLSKSGNYLSGDPLEAKGKSISSEKVITDGPFIEAKEAITGYILLKAKDMDHVLELIQDCPVFDYGGALEVRPIMKY